MKRFRVNSTGANRRSSQMKTYEALEQRVVLAADVMNCLVSPIDGIDANASANDVAEVCPVTTSTATCQYPSELESTSIDAGCLTPSGTNALTFDLQDGSDGMMLPLAGLDSNSIEITATQDGQLTINCAADFGQSTTSPLTMELKDADGNVIASTADQTLGDTFATLQVDVCEGDQLTLSLTNGCCDPLNVQVTAGIADTPVTETPAPTDMMNFLLLGDDDVAFSRSLQVENDVDQFQFTASADGRTTLDLLDMSHQDSLDLKLTVTDSDNNLVAQGSTNELVELAFETQAGQTYTVTVAEGSGKTADYQVSLKTLAHPVVAETIEAGTENDCNVAIADESSAAEPTATDDQVAADEAEVPASDAVADCDLPVAEPVSLDDSSVACDESQIGEDTVIADVDEQVTGDDSIACDPTGAETISDSEGVTCPDDSLVNNDDTVGTPGDSTQAICPVPDVVLDSCPIVESEETSLTVATAIQPQISFVIDSSEIENVWVIGDVSQLPVILASANPSTAIGATASTSNSTNAIVSIDSTVSDASNVVSQPERHQRDAGQWGQRHRRVAIQNEIQAVDQYFEGLGNSQVLELV